MPHQTPSHETAANAGNIVFADSMADGLLARHADRVLHILCMAGSMSFDFCHVRYNIVASDYAIIPTASLASGFSASDDCRAVVMLLSDSYVTSMALHSNYGIVGHLALLQNPVMRLTPEQYRVCLDGLMAIRRRMADDHMFREEMLGHLLMAHILDLYDIHARQHTPQPATERARQLLGEFVAMLFDNPAPGRHQLAHYASRLCITPHYLSELCSKLSGQPASYWIDRATARQAAALLRQPQLTLTQVADMLGFSSQSYFCRYVQRHFGMTPTQLRRATGNAHRQ